MLTASNDTLPPMTIDHLADSDERPRCVWPRRAESCGKPWYLLLIEPQQEVRVSVVLNSYRIPNFLPMMPQVTTRGVRRTKVTTLRPFLRGYLLIPHQGVEPFVELSERRPLPVHGFLRFGDVLARVSDGEVLKLRHIEQELAKPKPIQSIWDVGEVVRISEGPFTGLNATITDLANGTRIRVDLSFMRRAVSTTLDADHLEKL